MIRIKRFKDLKKDDKEKSGDLYPFGCVMLDINFDNWDEIISMVDERDLSQPDDDTKGIETNPHVTLLYGLHKEVSDMEIKRILEKYVGELEEIYVEGIGIFENEDFDVVKMNVVGDILHQINSELQELPNSNEFPEYKPHITIAYVKSGKGKKYVDPDFFMELNNFKKFVYKKTDGTQFSINLDPDNV